MSQRDESLQDGKDEGSIVVVKSGVAQSGASWELSYRQISGEHCLEMTVDGARLSDVCGLDIPETTEVGFGGGLRVGRGDYFLYGMTSARVSSIRAESADGDTEVGTEELPEHSPTLKFRFFVLTRKPIDNVDALVALDAKRSVIQRIELPRA
jgi:hypothetical protein